MHHCDPCVLLLKVLLVGFIAKWSDCYERSESYASVMVKAIVRSIYARKTTKNADSLIL